MNEYRPVNQTVKADAPTEIEILNDYRAMFGVAPIAVKDAA